MNDIYEIIKPLVPVRLEAMCGALAGAFGALTSYFFGEWDRALEALLILMVLDYLSGMLAAFINPKLSLNSQKGFRGIARKLYILVLVALAHLSDQALGTTEICTMATFFYLANEGLSIIENGAKAGVPIPKSLKDSLEQLSQQKQTRDRSKKGANNG